MPCPWARGRTAYVARIHISSRVYDVAKPTIPSASSATQQPPGSVSRKCRVRMTQASPRSGDRGCGSGQDRRNIRLSSSRKPSELSRSAVGRSASAIGRMVASVTSPTLCGDEMTPCAS